MGGVGWGMTADATISRIPIQMGILGQGRQGSLEMAGIHLEEIDYIQSTWAPPLCCNDRVETRMLKDVFGKQAYHIPISSTKSITGHLMGAAGGVEPSRCCWPSKKGLSILHQLRISRPRCDL